MPPERKEWDPNTQESWRATVAGWEWRKVGRVWKVEGSCPRCGHTMDHEIPIGTHVAGVALEDLVLEADELPPAPVPVTVRCNWRETHEGRPEAFEDGCGPSVNLTLPPLS